MQFTMNAQVGNRYLLADEIIPRISPYLPFRGQAYIARNTYRMGKSDIIYRTRIAPAVISAPGLKST
jgi:hypothetical protein